MSEEINSAPPVSETNAVDTIEEPSEASPTASVEPQTNTVNSDEGNTAIITDDDSSETQDGLEEVESEESINKRLLDETGGTMVFVELFPLMQELKDKNPDEVKALLESNPAKRKLYEVALNLTYQGEQVFNLEGNPLSFGESATITKIKGVSENGSLVCEVTQDGKITTQEIPRKEVMFLQLASEKDAITQLLPPEAQQLFSKYIEALKNNGDVDFGEDFNTLVEGARQAYLQRAQEMSADNPERQAVLELLQNPNLNIDAILEVSVTDPEEKERLKALIESGDLKLGALLLLMLVVGGFSAATSISK